MPAMKRKINTFLALLFILSTLTTSLHEMMPQHDESSCEVCILVQHDSGLVPQEYAALPEISACCGKILLFETQRLLVLIPTTNPRAPPFFS
jgi:hypothetical protein